MTDQDLQAIQALLEQGLAPINKRLDAIETDLTEMKEDIAAIKESQEEVRDATNALLEWSDKISASFQFPLPRL